MRLLADDWITNVFVEADTEGPHHIRAQGPTMSELRGPTMSELRGPTMSELRPPPCQSSGAPPCQSSGAPTCQSSGAPPRQSSEAPPCQSSGAHHVRAQGERRNLCSRPQALEFMEYEEHIGTRKRFQFCFRHEINSIVHHSFTCYVRSFKKNMLFPIDI